MIEITVTCSMCVDVPTLVLEGLEAWQLDKDVLAKLISAEGWVVQFNGKEMDTYCSKECAE